MDVQKELGEKTNVKIKFDPTLNKFYKLFYLNFCNNA